MFFQVILFLLNFKKIREIKGNTKNYCYFIVPIKNNQVDFECLHCFAPKNFLKGNIYQNLHSEHLKTNFLYNPFNKTFYLFDKISKRKITEQETFNKETKTFLEFFEERYNTNLLLKEGDNLLIDGYLFNGKKTEITNVLSAEIMQLTSIPENICNSFEKVMKNFYALEKACLSHEFIEKHRLKLSNQIVLQCFCAKEEEYDNYERLEFLGDSVLKFVTTKHIFLSENNEHEMIVLQNKNSVNKDANKNETQTKALYNTDVNTNYNDRNVQNIVDYNDMGDIVTEKDKYISNKSLYGIASSLDITSFFSFTKYSSSLFQPPNIGILVDNSVDTQFKEECKNIISYFQAEKIFASKNVSYHENKALQDETKIRGSKTYADIVEALIGAHFVELGFKISEEFIHGIGVYDKYKKNNNLEKCYRTVIYDNNATENNKEHVLPDRMPNTVENKAELINNKKAKHNNSRKIGLEKIDCGLLIKKATVYYKDTKLVKEMKIYKNILTEKEIEDIENILNYKFKNKGLIEKAMIHPSSHRNILGSLQFNRLELLGDSALDLVITEYIYDKHKDFDPEKLHVKRKSYVNNFSLARVLFKSNLFRYLHICFDYEHVQNVIKKLKTDGETVNKAFGDVFESVCGAIVVDMDFCFYTFKNYVLTNLYSYLFDCKDETR
ncbi:Dicer dimerization domain [Binucleata daphniae]